MDPSALLVAALIPLVTSLAQQNNKLAPPAPADVAPAPVAPPPSMPDVPSAPSTSKAELNIPSSPPSTPASYIRNCLLAFQVDSGIDLVHHENMLAHRDLTPDIIYDVRALRLCWTQELMYPAGTS
jgi:hypothetical protein